MILKIGISLAIIIGLFLSYVAIQPNDFQVSREITIHAPPENIFPYINNSRLMNEWNPWSDLDPAAQMTFSGPESGVGAQTNWANGKKLGTGSATVVESVANQRVGTKLVYVKPMHMEQDAEISLRAEGEQTVVKWQVRGKNSFVGRVICAFGNMDKMIGGTFEKGLVKLKAKTE